MKKTLLVGALFIAGLASAFPFRTSCGTLVNVTGSEGSSTAHLTNILESINYTVCGERAQIIIYSH